MSLNISNVTLHQLQKNDQEELVVNFRSEPLENDASTESLVVDLHRVYNAKASKGFGVFAEDSDFQGWLKEFRNGEKSFYDFTRLSADRLNAEFSKYPFAEEGTLVFAEYQSLATDYLLLGLLPSNESLKVTEGLNISATQYLDISKMDIVARIDLSTYETDKDSNRYLSFIKGRVGRKVADFFLDFLQAEVGLDSKIQNKVLMQAVDDFCSDSKLEKTEVNAFKGQVATYCNEQINCGDEINVKDLSGELPPNEEGVNFLAYTQEQGYELEDSFPGDRTSTKKLTKFVGAGGGLNISFDSTLLGERIFYDAETDTITIKGTPPNIRAQLARAKT